MQSRILPPLLAVATVISLVAPTFAAEKEVAAPEAASTHFEEKDEKSGELIDKTAAAQELYDLGLFKGIGDNSDGTPNFDLDRTPSREEAITMLIRLVGDEQTALDGTWTNSFTDVSDWAKPYVGFAYYHNVTNGINAEGTLFGGGPDYHASAATYLTLVLRTLGYQTPTDFEWNTAYLLANKIGLTHGEYDDPSTPFTRGDVALISLAALDVETTYGTGTIREDLENAGIIPVKSYVTDWPTDVWPKGVLPDVGPASDLTRRFDDTPIDVDIRMPNGEWPAIPANQIKTLYDYERGFKFSQSDPGLTPGGTRLRNHVSLYGKVLRNYVEQQRYVQLQDDLVGYVSIENEKRGGLYTDATTRQWITAYLRSVILHINVYEGDTIKIDAANFTDYDGVWDVSNADIEAGTFKDTDKKTITFHAPQYSYDDREFTAYYDVDYSESGYYKPIFTAATVIFQVKITVYPTAAKQRRAQFTMDTHYDQHYYFEYYEGIDPITGLQDTLLRSFAMPKGTTSFNRDAAMPPLPVTSTDVVDILKVKPSADDLVSRTDIDSDGYVKAEELYKYFIIDVISDKIMTSVLGDGGMTFGLSRRDTERDVGTYRQTLKVTSKASGLSKYTDIYVEYLGEAKN